MLNEEGRRRRDRRYPRAALKFYKDSPFKYLYTSKNDQALLNACGVDHEEFTNLLNVFGPYFQKYTYDQHTGRIKVVTTKRGRPRSLDAIGCLGLVLFWYRTKGAAGRTICLVFGITNTPLDRWLLFGKLLLFESLKHYKPTIPSERRVQSYIDALGTKYPHAKDVGFACDGAKFNIQKPPGDIEQSKYYNGWTRGHYISCIFVFAPDGTIPITVLNAPGSLHDSAVAFYGGVYDELQELYNKFGVRTVVDSAFKIGEGNFLLKSAQTDPDVEEGQDPIPAVLANRDATSIRQLAEWGMHQIRCKFPRMDDTIRYEEKGLRRLDLSLMIRLYNHQCETIGMNQILNTFMLQVSKEKKYFSYGGSLDATANELAEQLAMQI
jgi:hypothetical protein